MTPIQTDQGFLVLISRTDGSTVRTTHRKRRGSRCSIRRYDLLYPSMFKEPARHIPIGYGFADEENVAALQAAARRKEPFYAYVATPFANRVYIASLATPDEAKAVIRRALEVHKDAEWEASAPR